MPKKIKKVRKIKIKTLLITIISFIVVFGVIHFLTKLPITNIYIKGNNYLNDIDIMREAGIIDYPSFVLTSKNSIRKKLLNNPYIKEIKVNKKFFGTIEIKVEEKNILFKKVDDNNKIVFNDGTEIENNDDIYGIPILLNYVPDTKYGEFIEKMNDIDNDTKMNISEIRYYPNNQDEDRFLLHMNDGNYVYLTLTKFKQINYYKDVLDQLDGKKGILYLDSGNHFKEM